MRVRILFVDDEDMVLRAIRRALQREGFELFFATDPHDAIQLVAAHHIDIIVSDYQMAPMTGVELLALIARLHSHTLRMLMTGQADKSATVQAINEGSICRYIEKPWNNDELKQILHDAEKTVLRKRAAAAPNPAAAVQSFRRSVLRDADLLETK